MKKVTVTSELRKSIKKVVPKFIVYKVYSDTRAHNSVGVKIVCPDFGSPVHRAVPFTGASFSGMAGYEIMEDMKRKGFKVRFCRRNRGGLHQNWGTRFCFYKPGFDGPDVSRKYPATHTKLWSYDPSNPEHIKLDLIDTSNGRYEFDQAKFENPGPWDALGPRGVYDFSKPNGGLKNK
jgi:hypothetical protein